MTSGLENTAQKALWDTAWSHAEAQPWYPDEQVVRFLARHVARRTGFAAGDVRHSGDAPARGLDAGCGKGRHVITLAELGLEACGVDISDVSVEFARQWLAARGLEAEIRQAPLSEIPYQDEAFDFIICHGVLDHMLASDRKSGLSEMRRVLKTGGLLFVSVINPGDSAYGNGTPVEDETWLVAEGFEKDIPQAFFTEQRLADELDGFQLESVTRQISDTMAGRSLIGSDKHYARDDRYYAVARKS